MHRLKSMMLAGILLVAGSIAALPHGKVTSTTPDDGAKVPAGLSQIQLDFSHPMRLTVVKVTRVNERREVAKRSALPTSFEKSAKVIVDALQTGSYEVSWTAVADDGHVMNGSFKFTVGDPEGAKSQQ